MLNWILEHGSNWLWWGAILAGALLVAFLAHSVLFRMLNRIDGRGSRAAKSLIRLSRRPSNAVFLIISTLSTVQFLPLSPDAIVSVKRLLTLGLIAAIAWLTVSVTEVIEDLLQIHYRIDVPDNLNARKMLTRIRVFRRVLVMLIAGLTVTAMLMTFPSLRRLGTSILASAGLAGLIAGIAARPTLSNLIAGLQVALSEPVSLDDVVVVEGEWGRIEEITTTYVVVRIWDERRLVLPLTYFITNPFQNWTRTTADLLGTVYLYTDYTVPVEEVRQELGRILKSSGMWDGKTWGLQVTDAKKDTLELRALMSASDSSNAWDLRCHVRERLVEYLQKNCPNSLPKVRAEIWGARRELLPDRKGWDGLGGIKQAAAAEMGR